MKILKLIFSFLFLLIANYSLLGFSSNNAIAQTSGSFLTSSSLPDTYTITLSGSTLNTVNALNITINFTPSGSAQLDNGFTLKATGASVLLSNVDASKNLITAVLNGAITDGKVVITGKLKQGSVNGNPIINIVKIEKSGGVNITNDLQITTSLTSSVQPVATPTPTETSTPTPTPTPEDTATPTPEEQLPDVSILGPETVVLKKNKLNVIRLKAVASNFKTSTRCTVNRSNTSLVKLTPRSFTLTPKRNTKIFFGNIPPRAARKLLKDSSSDNVTVYLSCTNADGDLDADKDITITAP